MTNPADEIQFIATDRLIPYARNSRTHSEEQIAQIAASIVEWGFTNPILIDEECNIIAGHGRTLAAQKLGMTPLPVVVAAGWSDQKKRAYIIADNKLALNAGWDNDLLALELAELGELGFDLTLTGFSDDEIENLLPLEVAVGLTDEDTTPEITENPVTVLGDVWILGDHRLMCGDSTQIDAISRLMEGQMADMMFTDPPYGVSYGGGRRAGVKPKNRQKFGTRENFGEIKNDDLRGEQLTNMVHDAISSAKMHSKEGVALYICFPWRTYNEFDNALIKMGIEANACIVWDKKYIGLGNANYRPQHEFIFYIKGGSWHGDKAQSDIWSMSRANGQDYVHPTQKPVELIERALNNSSKKGDIVIDCFGGSGSTMIACEKNKRHARLMELDPKYCDVIIKRWQDFTGRQAIHAETGLNFSE